MILSRRMSLVGTSKEEGKKSGLIDDVQSLSSVGS